MERPDHLRQCETLEQRLVLYQSLPNEQKEPALAFLRDRLAAQAEDFRTRYAANPQNWWVGGHFGWGMTMRNALRAAGFGETYFHIANLDDIYIPLIEEALGLGGEAAS